MSYVLDNVTTADQYNPANTLVCTGAVRVNFEIREAGIYYRLYIRHPRLPQAVAGPEIAAGRSMRSLDRKADKVEIRSQVAGEPARVTVEALLEDEL